MVDGTGADSQSSLPTPVTASITDFALPTSSEPQQSSWDTGGDVAAASKGPGRLSSSPTDTGFGPLSPSTQDRVFPIRSVVSVDANLTPSLPSDDGDSFLGVSASKETVQALKRRSDTRKYSNASIPSARCASESSYGDTSSRHSRVTSRENSVMGDLSTDRTSPFHSTARDNTAYASGDDDDRRSRDRQMNIVSDDLGSESEVAPSTKNASASVRSGRPASIRSYAEDGAFVTARFKHIVTEEGHLVVTGRGGDTLQRCEDEPIHIPGAVQSFGLLVVLREEGDGKLSVRVVSENSKRIIGYAPKQLFALESFCDIFSDDQADNLLDHLEFIKDADSDPASDGPAVFTLSVRSPAAKRSLKMWCAMHINPKSPDMIICEFELENDPEFPLIPHDEFVPDNPESTLQSNPTADELAESTSNLSKPLRVLRSARRKNGDAAAMEVFNILSQVQEQLAAAPSLEAFLKILVGVVKELTGFHRVMVYQFDTEWNGRVVTELVDPRATKDLYKGLNFPASDIPKQARDLYKINKVRLLYDRDHETARLVCRTMEDLEDPIDMSYAYLRAMSPIHIKYLANMAVRSSMSISINAFSELWGLISCHSYGPKGMRVSFPIRKMCRLIGDSASRNIERLSYASRLQARKLINTLPTAKNSSGYIIASSEDLLALFSADYGLLSIRDEIKILGNLGPTQEALALVEYLRLRKPTSVFTSQDIRFDFPDLRYEPGFRVIAGLLLVPLSAGGDDFIVFFRKGQLREVKWAGNPHEKFIKEGTEGYLEPRKSFKTWSETVVGKCKEWTEEQIETAAVLCLVYGKFIDVWRQKEAALQSTQLTRLLLANSAHEVRTPLNAIINYLEIAMEGVLDPEMRENLSKSHSASKSLIYVINDLLDLTKTEQGNELVRDDVFDLPATVKEATDMFANDAKRKKLTYDVIVNQGVPQNVVGDQRRVRQVISNVTANAIQHTSTGFVKIELWLARSEGQHADIDIVIQDTGVGMSTKKLDELFMQLEQVQSEEVEDLLEKSSSSIKAISPARTESSTLGLGLAVVSRIIRNMNGQLRLKSEEGVGSRFVIQLGFDLPSAGEKGELTEAPAAGTTTALSHPTTPPATEDEVMLVAKTNEMVEKPHPNASCRGSRGSINSMKSTASLQSFKSTSSGKSDVDRLIDAIQEPHMVSSASVKSPSGSMRRKSSHRSLSRPSFKRNNSYTLEPTRSNPPAPGEALAADQGTPIKPIRIQEDDEEMPAPPSDSRSKARVSFEVAAEKAGKPKALSGDHLNVLVAEDDPINSKIITKRLEKFGHKVYCTVNGEECSSAYGERHGFYDVVLMDMQMPIVDGLTSTKMIRSYEKTHPREILSERAAKNGRIPIVAVSASLVEKERQKYVDSGFDGWILKPIDFKRLSVLLNAIVDDAVRESCLYEPGQWESGGWFAPRQPDLFAPSATKPDSENRVGSGAPVRSFPVHGGEDPLDDEISREQRRLGGLEKTATKDASRPER